MFSLDQLTEEQRVSELVECELKDLPVEIRHTNNSEMREALHHRMEIAREIFNFIHESCTI
jgi:hypothetical protein